MKTSISFKTNIQVIYGDIGSGYPTKQVDTLCCVKKPLYHIRFGTNLPDDAVKLAYASIDQISPITNLNIIDRSNYLPENTFFQTSKDELFDTRIFTSTYKDVIFTDVFTTSTPTKPIEPLFYRHLIEDTGASVNSIQLLDINFEKINPYNYQVVTHYSDEAQTIIESYGLYNNYENSYDPINGNYNVYYVQYLDSTGSTKVELLSNRPAFREATFGDINPSSLRLKSWIKAYTIQPTSGEYQFTLPKNSTTYGARYKQDLKIKILNSTQDSNEEPWMVKVSNGYFISPYNSVSYKYWVPEFSSQEFNPISPYKRTIDEEAINISHNIIKVNNYPVEASIYNIYIIIRNKDDSVLYAITNDTSKIGEYYIDNGTTTDVEYSSDELLSVDYLNGFIHLNVKIFDYYKVYVTYYYEEKNYELTTLNLNPLFDNAVADNLYVVYMVPNQLSESIHYLRVGKDGLIKYCSDSSISADVSDMPYGRPIRNTESTDTTFLRKYTVEAPASNSGLTTRYLILADISVSNIQSYKDLSIIDLREVGGGLQEDKISLAKQLNPEVQWYGDIGLGGGLPYPAKCSVIVRLPHCLLDTYGGIFTENQIRDIVKRHMALGTYPIIRFYGDSPEISLNIDSNNMQYISWPSNPGSTYSIYLAEKEGNFSAIETGLPNNSSGNTYSFSGLTDGNKYSVKITETSSNPCGIVYDPAGNCWDANETSNTITLGRTNFRWGFYDKTFRQNNTAWINHEKPYSNTLYFIYKADGSDPLLIDVEVVE